MRKTISLACLFLFVLSSLSAQTISVKGKVKDNAGEPIIGAVVTIPGSTLGTITDIEGNYVLDASPNESLSFSYVGYKTVVVSIQNRKRIDMILREDVKIMDEVVVIAYGTARKSDLSGSVGSLKSEDLLRGGPSDLAQGLSGKIAGVSVMQNDGSPGGGVSINVRGANSFSTSSQPLYVIDGIPYENTTMPGSAATDGNIQQDNPLSQINPNDIESIEVLKDASATAIYGSRGANGVVLVTTKQGKKGEDIIELTASVSFSQVSKKLDYLDAYDYANFCNEQVENSNYYDGQSIKLPYTGEWSADGKYKPLPSDFLNPGTYTDPTGTYTDHVGVADWQDVIFQNAMKQEYNLRFSGGSHKGSYMVSGNYLNQEGVIKNSGFERYTLRANLNRNVRSWLKMGTNISFSNSNTNIAKTTTAAASGVLRAALIFPTTYDPKMENEDFSDELSWLSGNPYTYVNNAIDDLVSNNINTSSFIEIALLKSLKFRQKVGINYATKRRGTYYDTSTREGMYVGGLAGQSDNYRTSYVFESLLTWNKSFNRNRHRFNVLGGFTAEKAQYGSKSMSATQFPTDMTGYYDMGAGLNPNVLVSSYGENSLVSYILRANYTLYNKYIFTGTFRCDGSSKFVEDNKYAAFYSGAFAWRISEEKIIKDLDVFSNLKLRLSYGETGNQGINSYETFTQLGINNYPFAGGGLASGGAVTGDITSSDLRWETTRQYDAGLDFGFANNLVTFTADYYNKRTYDLLQTVVIPSSTGFRTMLVNSGNVVNSGFEFELGLHDVFRNSDWRWDISANMSFNKNKISGLEADQFAPRLYPGVENVFIQRNGMPIGAIYGYVEDGFYDNISEVKANPQYSKLSDAEALKMVGEVKYLDIDGKDGLTTGDMTMIGNTNPDFTYGISTLLSWKGVSLSLFFQGSQGNDLFNANLLDQNMGKTKNVSQEAYDTRWTPENAAFAKWPKATQESTRKMLVSDRYVEDASYFKLKNVNIEYLHRFKTNKIIKSMTVFANLSNLFTITDYSGYDPEVNSFGGDASRKGVDYYAYPSNRTYSLGVKLNF